MSTTILAYLFDLASLLGFGFIIYQAKNVPYLIPACIVILMIFCYPVVIQEHYKVMEEIFKGKTNEQMANTLLGLMGDPFAFVFFIAKYTIAIGAGLVHRLILQIANFHEIVVDVFNVLMDHLSYYVTQLLGYPFNLVMDLLRRFAQWTGLQITSLLELIQQGGNILINAWIDSKQKAIQAWFGEGDANTDSYNKLVVMVFLYGLLVGFITWSLWKIGWFIYQLPFVQDFEWSAMFGHK